jgi:hypothetical protein
MVEISKLDGVANHVITPEESGRSTITTMIRSFDVLVRWSLGTEDDKLRGSFVRNGRSKLAVLFSDIYILEARAKENTML